MIVLYFLSWVLGSRIVLEIEFPFELGYSALGISFRQISLVDWFRGPILLCGVMVLGMYLGYIWQGVGPAIIGAMLLPLAIWPALLGLPIILLTLLVLSVSGPGLLCILALLLFLLLTFTWGWRPI